MRVVEWIDWVVNSLPPPTLDKWDYKEMKVNWINVGESNEENEKLSRERNFSPRAGKITFKSIFIRRTRRKKCIRKTNNSLGWVWGKRRGSLIFHNMLAWAHNEKWKALSDFRHLLGKKKATKWKLCDSARKAHEQLTLSDTRNTKRRTNPARNQRVFTPFMCVFHILLRQLRVGKTLKKLFTSAAPPYVYYIRLYFVAVDDSTHLSSAQPVHISCQHGKEFSSWKERENVTLYTLLCLTCQSELDGEDVKSLCHLWIIIFLSHHPTHNDVADCSWYFWMLWRLSRARKALTVTYKYK